MSTSDTPGEIAPVALIFKLNNRLISRLSKA
jgi:hypothetical protein